MGNVFFMHLDLSSKVKGLAAILSRQSRVIFKINLGFRYNSLHLYTRMSFQVVDLVRHSAVLPAETARWSQDLLVFAPTETSP